MEKPGARDGKRRSVERRRQAVEPWEAAGHILGAKRSCVSQKEYGTNVRSAWFEESGWRPEAENGDVDVDQKQHRQGQ